MPAIQTRLSQVGVAKQSAKGASATNPTYAVGVSSGILAKAEVTEEDLPLTWSDRVVQGHDRITVLPGFEFETIVTPKMAGFLVYATLGTDTVTGAGPYVHTCKPALDLPYLGIFGRMDGTYVRIDDAKIDALELSWDRAGVLKAKVSGIGCVYTVLGSAWTATTPEQVVDGTFGGVGGTMSLNGSAAVIKQGSIKITNGIVAVYGADAVLPKDVFPGIVTNTVSLTVVPADLSLFKLAVTGSLAGTTVSASPTYSTASLAWFMDANNLITATINRMKTMTAFPAASPAGGPAEVIVEGKTSAPTAAGDAFTIAVKNAVPTY
jgi:hypothetical protein